MVVFLSLDVGALEVDIGEEVAKDKLVITPRDVQINRILLLEFQSLGSIRNVSLLSLLLCLKSCNHFNSFALIKSRVLEKPKH